VDRKQTWVHATLLDPNHRVSGQPIVGVDHVEATDQILYLEDTVYHSPAHVVDVVHEIAMGGVGTTVIMDIIPPVMPGLSPGATGKHMNLVPFPYQRRRQFGHMGSDSANCDGM
jgi:hypothetical protein